LILMFIHGGLLINMSRVIILLLFIFRIVVIGRSSLLILMFIHGGLLINMSRVIILLLFIFRIVVIGRTCI
jgi:hypothetical protein